MYDMYDIFMWWTVFLALALTQSHSGWSPEIWSPSWWGKVEKGRFAI